jgi:cardiolipin synthase A/B
MSSYIPQSDNSSYPLRGGNQVLPLIDGARAFSRICDMVDTAEKSVWVTIAFINEDFLMPDGRGTFFEVCEKACQRGIDVRVIFWRSPEQESEVRNIHFHGQDYQAQWLADKNYGFSARWDYLPRGKCHHQKSWLIDAGTEREVAFVGGINLNVQSLVEAGHPATTHGSTHDIYCELHGPAATDVHHNFVQRWNEASERNQDDGAWPAPGSTDELEFPSALSKEAGNTAIQIGRTIRREQYTDTTPAVGASPFPVATGEKAILEQYLNAIDKAKRTIYIEDQAIASQEAMSHLEAALVRGVQVVFLVPGEANSAFSAARRQNPEHPMYDQLTRLGSYDNFMLVAICSSFPDASPERRYTEIYVHAKVAVVDDHWATIGSCNFADRSFHSDTELNVTFWDDRVAKQFRVDLLREHLEVDTADMSDGQAMSLYRQIAGDNRAKKDNRQALQGLAYRIDPETYGDQRKPLE